jgi:hypothetical protein
MEEFYASLPPTLHQGTENFLPLGTASVSLLPGPVSFRKDITSDTGVSSALTSFFRRHWFSRTWILQEVILLRKPVVMCGNATAPWAHVVATAAFLNLESRDDAAPGKFSHYQPDSFPRDKNRMDLDKLKRIDLQRNPISEPTGHGK